MATLLERHPVRVTGLPPHVRAFAAIEQRPDRVGGMRARVDRRGRVRFDHVWVRRDGAPPSPSAKAACGLTERDLRWLADKPRRGRRAHSLADAARDSGLFRLLYELDLTTAAERLGQFKRVEPRPEALATLAAWTLDIGARDEDLVARLLVALPPAAHGWATDEAARLLAAATDSIGERIELTDCLCRLAGELPAGGIPLSALADHVTHHTHGLDLSTRRGRIAARVAAAISGLPPPRSTADVRNTWEAVGVWVDRVSSQVSGWCLPLDPSHPAAAVAAAYDEAGEPAVLTLGLLDASPPLVAPPTDQQTIWVVEGVSVLTAVAARRVTTPVICRAGTPSVAVSRLVSAAVSAGWHLAVSSDFEPRGLQGAITLMRRTGLAGGPWRLTEADYLAGTPEGEPFGGDQVPDTPWDPALAASMRRRRERVSEESRLDVLLSDMQSWTRP